MKKLNLYDKYNREDIHSIFSPETVFTPQAGTWGLHGIVRIGKSKDYVFLVTAGTVVGEHEFDEGFTEDGVFRWQSQPKNTLKSPMIIDLVHHDEITNNIFLFYRGDKSADYTYLGLLKYLNHDEESGVDKEPVNFNWQLMNWPINQDVLKELNIHLEPGLNNKGEVQQAKFIVNDAPERKKKEKRAGVKKEKFKQLKIYNNPENEIKNKDLGEKGEKFIIEFEKDRLSNNQDLIKKIKHVSLSNDYAGYDILSFNEDGTERFIEVKTTKGPISSDFFISPGEIKFSNENSDKYFLYRVYDFDIDKMTGKIFIKKGSIEDNFDLTATNFKASI